MKACQHPNIAGRLSWSWTRGKTGSPSSDQTLAPRCVSRPLRFFVLSRVPAKPIPVAPLANNLLQAKMLLQSLQSATADFESTLDGSLHGGFSMHVVSKPALLMLLGKHGQSLWLPYPIWLLGPGIVKRSLEISQCDNVLEIKPFWFGEHFRTERFWKNTNSVSEPLAGIVDSYTTCVLDAVCDFTSNVTSSNHLSVMNSHNAEVNM